jgi:hypothetical protein
VINVGRSPNDRSLIDALVTTLSTVFTTIHVMDIPGTFNSMVYATVQPTTMDYMIENYNNVYILGGVETFLLESMYRAIIYAQPLPEPTIVLTDDRAPVEWIVNKMVLTYVLSGSYEELQ